MPLNLAMIGSKYPKEEKMFPLKNINLIGGHLLPHFEPLAEEGKQRLLWLHLAFREHNCPQNPSLPKGLSTGMDMLISFSGIIQPDCSFYTKALRHGREDNRTINCKTGFCEISKLFI